MLMPAGFMPAALSSGWYLQVCPGGLPAGLFGQPVPAAERASHRGHGTHASDAHHYAHSKSTQVVTPSAQSLDDHRAHGSIYERCDFGSVFQAMAPPLGVNLDRALAVVYAQRVRLTATKPRPRWSLFATRAPPIHLAI